MKRIFVSLMILILVIGCQQAAEKPVDVEAEKAVIKAVLKAQLDAIKAHSYEGEAAVWAHTPYIVRKKVKGWDRVSDYYRSLFEKAKKDPNNYQFYEATLIGADIYVNGNFASAFTTEHAEFIWEGEKVSNNRKPHKNLEKINGEWKIITLF
ncbi:hypothetical protein BVY01_02625 [bacterium I07]|nr:hypothetical protein BVY01_02625 [bacterium I07]